MSAPDNLDGKTVSEWAGAVGAVGAVVAGAWAWAWGKARAVARMEKRLEECVTIVDGDERWMRRSECQMHNDAILREITLRFDGMDKRLNGIEKRLDDAVDRENRRASDSGGDFPSARHP